MPSHKENIPPALNDLIVELLGLKLYKETYYPVNNKASIISLRTQPLLNQFNIVPITIFSIKWYNFYKLPNYRIYNCRVIKTPISKPKNKKRYFT